MNEHGLLHRIKSRLTYSNVTATLAVFLALGGTAQAIIIHGKDIKKGTVTAKQLAKNSVGTSEIKTGAVGRKELKPGAALMPGDLQVTGFIIDGGKSLAEGAGFVSLAQKGIILQGGKNQVLVTGHLTVEDQAGRGTPATVKVQVRRDGSPVGDPCWGSIADGRTETLPVSFIIDNVPPGSHTFELLASTEGSDGATVMGGTLNLVALGGPDT